MATEKTSPSSPSTRKKKQKRAKTTAASQQQADVQQHNGESMTQCVALCQEQRWREALVMCRRMIEKAEAKNDTEMLASLQNARVKIEYSLRRQMTAALIVDTQSLLSKEYLLDVGEQ